LQIDFKLTAIFYTEITFTIVMIYFLKDEP
jgi:hypothetical protein